MQKIYRPETSMFWLCPLLFSLWASWQVYQTTVWGAGLSSDSVSYLDGARKIVENGNLNGLGSHWPPLYFILIALSGLVTSELLVALRWLQIVTLFANVLVFAYVLRKSTNGALVSVLVGLLVFVTSPSVLHIHTMAWSEASFCLFSLLGFHFLADYLEHNSSLGGLIFSALFVGLAFITRYVGMTLVLTGMIALVIFTDGDKKKRIASNLIFCFVSSFPMLLWMGRNLLVSNEATSRQVIFHPVSMEKIKTGIKVLQGWLFIPGNYWLLLPAVLVLLSVLYLISRKQVAGIRLNRMPEICFIFVFTYISFLLFSISFLDAQTPLDTRILFPVYVFFVLGVVVLNVRISYMRWMQYFSYLVLMLMLLLVFAQLRVQERFIAYATGNGIGFASKKWAQSDTLQWVKSLPSDTLIYTNGPDPLRVYTGRASRMIPRHSNPNNRQKNEAIVSELNTMVSKLSEQRGVIIYFNEITWRWYLPTVDQLSHVLPIQQVYKGNDGIVVQLSE